MDYLSYWRLHRRPFVQDPAAASCVDAYHYSGSAQRMAIAEIGKSIADHSKGLGPAATLLVGPRGVGSTWLLNRIAGMQGFESVAAEMIDCSGSLDKCKISTIAQSNQPKQIVSVMLIDDCTLAKAKTAGELLNRHSSLVAVFSTSSTRADQLTRVVGHSAKKVEVRPSELEGTNRYIVQAMQHAGSDREIFSDQSISRLHQFTDGKIAILANHAENMLRLAASQKMKRVNSGLIDEALSKSRAA